MEVLSARQAPLHLEPGICPVDHNRPTYRELIALAARAFHRDAHHTVIPDGC